jgi:protein SCO1/2
MKKIQDSLTAEGMPVRIISFTVDPDYDTPEILKTYATEQQADLSSWSFLTGYEFEAVRKLSVDGFKVALQQASPGTGNDQIVHGTNFYLISPKGEIVKKYDGVGAGGKEQLMADLQKVH